MDRFRFIPVYCILLFFSVACTEQSATDATAVPVEEPDLSIVAPVEDPGLDVAVPVEDTDLGIIAVPTVRIGELIGAQEVLVIGTLSSAELVYPGEEEAVLNIESYKVELAADSVIEMPGLPGEFHVWIGEEGYEANFPTGLATDSGLIQTGGENQSAIIRPTSAGMDFEPATSECVRLDPTGITTTFKMLPKQNGSVRVGATVQLYADASCSGTPAPKSATTLVVTVEVNRLGIIQSGITELTTIAWSEFASFWKWLCGFLFFTAAFLIRRKMKKTLAQQGIDLPDEPGGSE